MTGDTWLLPGKGRGYSWRQLSLDHAASGCSLLGWRAEEMFAGDLGRDDVGEVEVKGRSFRAPVRSRNLLFDSVQNLRVSGEKRMILSFLTAG